MEKEKIFLEAARRLGINPEINRYNDHYSEFVDELNNLFHPTSFKKGDMLIYDYYLYEVMSGGPLETTIRGVRYRFGNRFPSSYVRENYWWVPREKWQIAYREINEFYNQFVKITRYSKFVVAWRYFPLICRIYEQCGLLKNESKAISSWIEETDGGVF